MTKTLKTSKENAIKEGRPKTQFKSKSEMTCLSAIRKVKVLAETKSQDHITNTQQWGEKDLPLDKIPIHNIT